MANKLKAFAMYASTIAGMVSANTIVVGCCMLDKGFASASASTLLNAMYENKFKAFASAAILPAIALAVSGYYVWVAYTCSLKDETERSKTIILNAVCTGKLSESLRIMPAIATDFSQGLIVCINSLPLCIYTANHLNPKELFFLNLGNGAKACIAGAFQGAFSPRTTPLLGTLSAVQLASSLIMWGLREEQGR